MVKFRVETPPTLAPSRPAQGRHPMVKFSRYRSWVRHPGPRLTIVKFRVATRPRTCRLFYKYVALPLSGRTHTCIAMETASLLLDGCALDHYRASRCIRCTLVHRAAETTPMLSIFHSTKQPHTWRGDRVTEESGCTSVHSVPPTRAQRGEPCVQHEVVPKHAVTASTNTVTYSGSRDVKWLCAMTPLRIKDRSNAESVSNVMLLRGR